MPIAINLLPPEPGKAILKSKRKKILVISEIIIGIFLIINLGIFGYNWYLKKNTTDKLAAIESEKLKISNLITVEKIYLDLGSKLLFLSTIWDNQLPARQVLEFAQSLTSADTTVTNISLQKNNQVLISFKTKTSDTLETLLNIIVDKNKNLQIKEPQLVSLNKNEEGIFNGSIQFQFLR